MENNNVPYLCVGTFSKLLLRYVREDNSISNSRRFLSAKGNVVAETVIKYLISVLKMEWESDDINPSSMKTMRSELMNCKRDLFTFGSLKSNKDVIKKDFVKDVYSENPNSLEFMSDFVLYCIDKNKCKQMVKELLCVIRDDKGISNDTSFYIFGDGQSITKSVMVKKKTDFVADCFLLGVWQYIIRKRADNNKGGIETLKRWYGTESDINSKSYIGTDLNGNLWDGLGKEIKVTSSTRVIKEDISEIDVNAGHKLFNFDADKLSDDEIKNLDFLKNSRILKNLIKACIIGSCDIISVNSYANNIHLFDQAMRKCKLLVFSNTSAKLIRNDQIVLQQWLEQFMNVIKPSDEKELYRETYCSYSKQIINYIEECKLRFKEVYNTLFGSCTLLRDERISHFLSIYTLM